MVLLRGLFGQGSFPRRHRVFLLLQGIYPFAEPICYGWTQTFKTIIYKYHHGLLLSNLVFSWALLLASPNVCLLRRPSSSPCNFFHVINPFGNSVMFFLFPYFIPKLFCFLCIRLWILHQLGRIFFRYLEIFCFVSIVWAFLYIYHVSLLLPISSDLFLLLLYCQTRLLFFFFLFLFFHSKVKVKLTTLVEGDPKLPFSIATTPRCREGATPFPGLLHFTLDPYLIVLSVQQGGIKFHFLSLWYDSTSDWTPVSQTIGENFTY